MEMDMRQAELTGISLCDLNCSQADVGSVNLTFLSLRSNRQCYRPTAGAKIGNAPIGLGRDSVDRGLNQQLCIRTWNQHSGTDMDWQGPEFCFSRQVSNRVTKHTLLDQLFKSLGTLVRQLQLRVGVQKGPCRFKDVCHQYFCIETGRWAVGQFLACNRQQVFYSMCQFSVR